MAQYKLTLRRISYSAHEVIVEADFEDQALAKGHQMAGDLLYNEYNADYEIEADRVREV